MKTNTEQDQLTDKIMEDQLEIIRVLVTDREERDKRVRDEVLREAAYAVDKASLRGAPALTKDQTHAVMDGILALAEKEEN